MFGQPAFDGGAACLPARERQLLADHDPQRQCLVGFAHARGIDHGGQRAQPGFVGAARTARAVAAVGTAAVAVGDRDGARVRPQAARERETERGDPRSRFAVEHGELALGDGERSLRQQRPVRALDRDPVGDHLHVVSF